MQTAASGGRQDGLALFFALAFAISWLGWLGVLTLGSPGKTFLVLVALGPPIAAMVAARHAGRISLRTSLQALTRWRARPLDYAFALLVPLVLFIGNTVAALLDDSRANALPASPLAWAYVAQCLLANPLEELGWRGFALPALCARMSPARQHLGWRRVGALACTIFSLGR